MLYEEIEQGLMNSIKDDDPHQFSKQQQIKRWTVLYWSLFEIGEGVQFVSQALSNKDYWNEVKDESRNEIDVVLNREKISKKLLDTESNDGNKSPLDSDNRYYVACLNCFEDKIKEIFEEFRKEYNLDSSKESTEKLIRMKGKRPLTTFWSHFINKDVLSANEYSYEYGLERAKSEGCIEAISFFWDRLSEDKKTSERLIDIAIYQSVTRYASLDMIMFFFRKSSIMKKEERLKQLLKKDFEKNRYYRTFDTLIENYHFVECKELFNYLIPKKDSSQLMKPAELSYEAYNILMFSILDRINFIPDNDTVNIGKANELIDFMYKKDGFELHKKSFIDEVSCYNSPTRHRILEIISNKYVKIVKEILLDIPTDKIKTIAIYDGLAANYLLKNKLFNLENLKQLMAIIDNKTGGGDNDVVNEEFRKELPNIIKNMENK